MASRASSSLRSIAQSGARLLFNGSGVAPGAAVGVSSSRSFASAAPVGLSSLPQAQDETPIDVEIGVPFKGHRLEAPDSTVTTSPKELLKFFSDMFLMRRMEIASDTLYKAKLIRGFCHLYDGQEAVCAGMEASLTYDDCIITSYRDHCTHLGRGGTVVEVLAELMGRSAGCAKGFGGSMHMYKREHNFYGGQGIVGAQTPVGAGLAFALKYSNANSVAIAMYGDGAANQGQLFEAMNMSALWDLPMIFVCENNHYGMGTAEWRGSKSPEFYCRGDYVPGIKVDGMDVLAVKKGVAVAKEHALKNGPIVMEMDTYRYHGHSMSDPDRTYRTREEREGVRQERDPIERVRKLLLGKEIVSPAELKGIEKQVKAVIDQALVEAKASPPPDPKDLFTNVYGKPDNVTFYGADRIVKSVTI